MRTEQRDGEGSKRDMEMVRRDEVMADMKPVERDRSGKDECRRIFVVK